MIHPQRYSIISAFCISFKGIKYTIQVFGFITGKNQITGAVESFTGTLLYANKGPTESYTPITFSTSFKSSFVQSSTISTKDNRRIHIDDFVLPRKQTILFYPDDGSFSPEVWSSYFVENVDGDWKEEKVKSEIQSESGNVMIQERIMLNNFAKGVTALCCNSDSNVDEYWSQSAVANRMLLTHKIMDALWKSADNHGKIVELT
jgi:hypothetical protein